MRDIHIAHLDKARAVVVLTREPVRPAMRRVTVAPITSSIKGLSTEVSVGPANGLDQSCVVSCDNIITIDKAGCTGPPHRDPLRAPGTRTHGSDRQRLRAAHGRHLLSGADRQ